MNVLITGATGHVGSEVLKSLAAKNHSCNIMAGVRSKEAATKNPAFSHTRYVSFNFEEPASFKAALTDCDLLFLLRPPQLANVKKYFQPLVNAAVECGVKHIVFLSVQGVERSKFIPHHQIEKLIVESGIAYTFLRPAYFMQNFTTTLRKDLVEKKQIFLPAGNAQFTLIDVADIGEVAANIILESDQHRNKAYDLTSNDLLTFGEMAEKLSSGLQTKIRYVSPGLLRFFRAKRKEKVPLSFLLVMIMLHYLPRFQKAPLRTEWVERLAGRKPSSFDEFICMNRKWLL